MRYVSLFSGIEAASVAWRPLGWEALAFAEIEPFPCAVLSERFPDVPNLGDVTKVDWTPYVGADVVVGGSPCQSFSVAGNRRGMDDDRGRLMLEYVRAIRDIRPRWLVWENVPGVLSQDGGRAFATLLRELAECGYSLAWRVLDAQFWRMAQRRRRVFVVGGTTAGRAAAILFEPGCVPGGSGKSKAKREALARAAGQRPGGQGGGCLTPGESQAQRIYGVDGPAPSLPSRADGVGANTPTIAFAQNTRDEVRLVNGDGQIAGALAAQPGMKQQTFVAMSQFGDVAGTLAARYDSSPCVDRGQNIVCMTDTQPPATIDAETCGALSMTMHKDPPVAAYAVRMREGKPGGGKGPLVSEDVSLTLATGSDQTVFVNSAGTDLVGALCLSDEKGQGSQYVSDGKLIGCSGADGWTVRRLTPLECERLQGFPDNWTAIPGAKDGPRYKAIGNSMAVPVMRWIGERIQLVDGIEEDK